MDRRFLIALIFLLFFLPVIHAQENTTQIIVRPDLSASDKAYLDGLNAKTIAQINSKLDTTQSRLEQTLKQSVDEARIQIKTEIVSEIKSSLKVIAIGLGGVILVVLSIMKIIEYTMSHNKRIKKYEDALKKQQFEYTDLVKQAKQAIQENETAKTELNYYKQSLDQYAVALGIKPTLTSDLRKFRANGGKMIEPPKPKSKFFETFWKIIKILIGIIVIGIIIGGIILIVNYFRLRG